MDWLHIERWLKDLYGTERIPTFERNKDNYQLFQQLQKFDFHSVEFTSSFMHGNLNLTENTRQAVHQLALMATDLGLQSTELSSFYFMLTKLKFEQMDTKHELDYLNEMEYTLERFQAEADRELKAIQSLFSNLSQEKEFTEKKEEKEPLKVLTAEYSQLEQQYHDLGTEKKGLGLSRLFELESKVNDIEKSLKEKKHALKTYDSLPSDMVLASMKIKETQQTLHELEQQRENLLTNIYSIK